MQPNPSRGCPTPRHPIFKGGCQPEFSSMAPPPCPSTTQCTVGGEALPGPSTPHHRRPQGSSKAGLAHTAGCRRLGQLQLLGSLCPSWAPRRRGSLTPLGHTHRGLRRKRSERPEQNSCSLSQRFYSGSNGWARPSWGEVTPKGDRIHAAAFVPVKLTQEPPEVPFVPDPGVSGNKTISANNLS